MNSVIQKFGGTSLGNGERLRQVAQIVQKESENSRVAVVVSAMSSYIKAEGTTNKLIKASQAALNDGAYIKMVQELAEIHHQAIEEAVSLENERGWAREIVKQELSQLKSFLNAIHVVGEITHRSEDVIISVGEKLSACILSATLNSMGIDAKYVNLDNLVHHKFQDTNAQFYAHVKEGLLEKVKNCGSKVPIITGFFGPTPEGILKSIGRGYTDFTAALLAAALKAGELQVWKEVDGIFSADPRIIPEARLLPWVFPEEASELTYYGSEVIHPFTMEQVIKEDIPIRIKNTFAPDQEGTLITPANEQDFQERKAVAVTCKRNVTMLNIHSNRMLMSHGFMAKVFSILEKHRVIIDLISTSEVNISLTFDSGASIQSAIAELEAIGEITLRSDMSILSLVGRNMIDRHGVAGAMFGALAEAGISIEMISQSASQINISCVIAGEQSVRALKAIHAATLVAP